MTDDERAATPPLGVGHRLVGDVAVVEIRGEVDAMTAPQLGAAVKAALDGTEGGFIVLDLTKVRFLGGSGLSTLVEVHRAAQRRGEPLRVVVDANRPVIRPLELTGLEDVLSLYHTVEEALAA